MTFRHHNRFLRLLHTYYKMIYLRALNRFSKKPIVTRGEVVVSLTSHGNRIGKAFYTIESIALGKELPARIILWLDDERALKTLPPTLQRLKKRGLEVQPSENYGPHTKYFPYVRSVERHSKPLVTADDDVLYDRNWLAGLVGQRVHGQDLIIAQRAHFINLMEDGRIAPYQEWTACSNGQISPRNFATGVSGVLYPPSFLDVLRQAGDSFLKSAPRADDVWLHATALRHDFLVKQVEVLPMHYPTIRGTQTLNLWAENVFSGGNDAQIRATYSERDTVKLWEVSRENSQG